MVPTLRYRARQAEHLDRQTWAGAFSFGLHGAVIGVRSADGLTLMSLRRATPPGARPSHSAGVDAMYSVLTEAGERKGGPRRFVLYEDSKVIARPDNTDDLIGALAGAIELKIATCARTRLYVHAGVVGWNGRAVLLPGRTHAGKSSLVAAMVRAGATYYSDEYAVLDDAGFVHPFPRPLGMRDADGRTHRVNPSSLGAVGDRPIPVRLVVVTQHITRARWMPKPMSPGETVLALMDNTVAAQSRPADALRILGAVATTSVGIRGARGDAVRVAERILAQC